MPTLELIAEIQFLKTRLAQCQEQIGDLERSIKSFEEHHEAQIADKNNEIKNLKKRLKNKPKGME